MSLSSIRIIIKDIIEYFMIFHVYKGLQNLKLYYWIVIISLYQQQCAMLSKQNTNNSLLRCVYYYRRMA